MDVSDAPARTSDRTALRPDIQGLRAVAVAAVVVFHLWPAALPGGYVGVDVFLVVSGFLITSHLLRRPPSSLVEAGRFWGRRVRRLLPASALVIVVSVLATALIAPETLHAVTGREAVASGLYGQNWYLARTAGDYLAGDDAATALRHYWTLSVEEQFYLVWPVVIGLAAWAGRRWWPRRVTAVVGVAIAAVVVSSLAYSAALTARDAGLAYYVTPTRMWELALGGLLAVAGPVLAGRAGPTPSGRAWPAWGRTVLAGAGLAAILGAAFAFDADTPFPGTWALLPTLGAVAVIAAEPGRSGPVGRLLAWRPAQFLGDVSYSTYLWHWPLVVLVTYAAAGRAQWFHLAGAAVASVALAAATKRWVEDPVRRSARLATGRATVGVLAACMAVSVGSGLALVAWSGARADDAAARVTWAEAAHPECFGAAAVGAGARCADVAGELWNSPVVAAADKPVLYPDGCWNEAPYATRVTCTYGTADGLPVALVGNSHAGHWFPPLAEIAADRGWRITTYLVSVCYPVDVDLAFPRAEATTGCSDWNAWVREEVAAGGYELVVMSARTDQKLAGVPEVEQDAVAQAAYRRVVEGFADAGAAVVVVRDTPAMVESVPDCVAVRGASACGRERAAALEVDPLALAAAELVAGGVGPGGDGAAGNVALVDVSDVMCGPQRCEAVVGGVIAYFDHGHLTATFARTLRPWLEAGVDEALG